MQLRLYNFYSFDALLKNIQTNLIESLKLPSILINWDSWS